MATKKLGANQGDQNFIRRCAEGEGDWSVQRISNHLRIEDSVVQNFYDLFSGKKEKPKKKAKKVEPTPEEDFI